MKNKILLFCYFFTALSVLGQTNFKNDNILYKKEKVYGVIFHSQGWGGNIKFVNSITAKNKVFWEANLQNLKHVKEVKVLNPFYENSKKFVYGKLNYCFLIRGSVGFQKKLYGKPHTDDIGIEVRHFTSAGLSLALLKPVYLKIVHTGKFSADDTIMEEKYNFDKHPMEFIYGRASFFKGFDEIKPVLGVHLKSGFGFEFASDPEKVKLLEIGTTLDFFPKKLEIMATKENPNFVLTFFISYQFGKKYYK